MSAYCDAARPMGDLRLDSFSCPAQMPEDKFGDRGAEPTPSAARDDPCSRPPPSLHRCVAECDARLAALRKSECALVQQPADLPRLRLAAAAAAAAASSAARSTSTQVPAGAQPCCEAVLGQLQKFCDSFKPPLGWPAAVKLHDPSHWDGGPWLPALFEDLSHKYAPAECGAVPGATEPRSGRSRFGAARSQRLLPGGGTNGAATSAATSARLTRRRRRSRSPSPPP